jgi:hypothetical protein
MVSLSSQRTFDPFQLSMKLVLHHGLRSRRILPARPTTLDQDCSLCYLDQHTHSPSEYHTGTTERFWSFLDPRQIKPSKLDTLPSVVCRVGCTIDTARGVLGDVVEFLCKESLRKSERQDVRECQAKSVRGNTRVVKLAFGIAV